ncbi:MAG: chloride channel protein [Elusimicrobia bacterium]|nr:chloride channel protein [Elusimicrobiota bacterium]
MSALWRRTRSILAPSDGKTLALLACAVGIATGAGSALFIRLVELFQFWPAVRGQARLFGVTLTAPMLVAIPAVGGLLCGAVLQFVDPAVKGTGTPEVIQAIRRKGGFLSGRYTLVKLLASVFTVCSGGAAGPEAPMVAAGAGVGSFVGRRMRLPGEYMRTLVAAGAAAGFASIFNAPIAGVLFAIEVLLKEFGAQSFAMVIMATVTASVTTYLMLGNRVFVDVPSTYAFLHIGELVFYLALGVLAALFSKLFIRSYFVVEKLFEKGFASPMARAGAGGLLLGLLGLLLPEALGNSHLVIPKLIEAEAAHPWAWGLLLFVLFGKMIACPLTVGSGGSGGIFIPYLFMGAALGGLVGRFVGAHFAWAAPSGAYMLVGMAAVFAGITSAPFTAIMLLFELTHDYNLILPVMFAVGVTVLVARAIDPLNLEGHKLLKKGVSLNERPELRALEPYRLGDVMNRGVVCVPEDMTLKDLAAFVAANSHTGYPVVDRSGRAVGLLMFDELRRALSAANAENPPSAAARDIMRAAPPTASPDEPIEHAIRAMRRTGADRVLIVDPAGERAIGIVTKGDLLTIYRRFFD